MDPLEVISLVETLFNLCTIIHNQFSSMNANKGHCKRLSQRIVALQDLFRIIKQRGPGQISASVVKALQELKDTLTCAEVSLIKYSQTKGVMCFLKANKFEGKFCELNERLSDNFQYLSGALQVEQGDILHKVHKTVSGQGQGEDRGSCQASTSHLPASYPSIVPAPPLNLPPPYTPAPNIMPPVPMFTPPNPIPGTYIVPPQTFLTSVPAPMAPMAPMAGSNVFVPNIVPGPVVRTVSPVQAAVLGTYIINKFYFV